MKQFYHVLLSLVVLAFPFSALAQEGDGIRDVNGTYALTGAYTDGTEPYTGTATFTGKGSFYDATVQFSYDPNPKTAPFLLMGNVMVDSYSATATENTVCAENAYTRDEDGWIFGLWLDPTNQYGVASEILIPTAPTTDFVGAYTIRGIYPSGIPYEGTVEIARDDQGLYTLNYNYPADEVNPELVTTGMGLMAGSVLGVTLPLDGSVAPTDCAIYVGEFQADGNFNAVWYENGRLGTETGIRQ